MNHNDNQTIIAQCTPHGSGALALVRLCGPDVFTCVDQFAQLASKKCINNVATHTIHYGSVVDDKNVIDNVLFLVMRAPRTFTGQHTVEITCHNNPFIIQAIIDRAVACGARIAQNGEFTKRSVLHNKIDLVQAESINDLIHANNQHSLKTSLAQVNGSFSAWVKTIEQDLMHALALSESSFEFIDEEDLTFAQNIHEIVNALTKKIDNTLKHANAQSHIRDGISITLVGSVNAGKSSLFNALIGKNRAIVTDIAGTTRDAIHAGVYTFDSYITFIDTAGLRKTNNVIEQHGITRSHEYAQQADIVLLVIDGSRTLTSDEESIYRELAQKYHKKTIIVQTKHDLTQQLIAPSWATSRIACSVNDNTSIKHVEDAIKQRVHQLLNTHNSSFLLNTRHCSVLKTLQHKLTTLKPMLLKEEVDYELVSYHLNDALAHISELTGKTISEDAMDRIFKEFCIGK